MLLAIVVTIYPIVWDIASGMSDIREIKLQVELGDRTCPKDEWANSNQCLIFGKTGLWQRESKHHSKKEEERSNESNGMWKWLRAYTEPQK